MADQAVTNNLPSDGRKQKFIDTAVKIEADKPVEKTASKEQKIEMDKLPTLSAKIRYLDKENFTRSQIAKIVDRRYQHVRNVLETPLKRPQAAKNA